MSVSVTIFLIICALIALCIAGFAIIFGAFFIRCAVYNTIDFFFYDIWGKPPFSQHCDRARGYGWIWDDHDHCIGCDPKRVG